MPLILEKRQKLGNTALSVGVIDTFVAVLAGVIIFPAAFSVGIQPDAGPSLIFITLPNVFQQAFSGIPFLAYVFSVLFYVLLALAALTSTISLHEVVTAFCMRSLLLLVGVRQDGNFRMYIDWSTFILVIGCDAEIYAV